MGATFNKRCLFRWVGGGWRGGGVLPPPRPSGTTWPKNHDSDALQSHYRPWTRPWWMPDKQLKPLMKNAAPWELVCTAHTVCCVHIGLVPGHVARAKKKLGCLQKRPQVKKSAGKRQKIWKIGQNFETFQLLLACLVPYTSKKTNLFILLFCCFEVKSVFGAVCLIRIVVFFPLFKILQSNLCQVTPYTCSSFGLSHRALYRTNHNLILS